MSDVNRFPLSIPMPIVVPMIGLTATLIAAHLIFGGFFPGPNGIGHDYAGGLPAMLVDYYWSLNEGNVSAPWFTPAFCGGIPWFADPGSMFYAFPSLFVRLLGLDPLAATYLTFLVFIGLGFLGAYLFGRQALGLSLQASLVAGVIFGLNGFYTHRMLVGHIGFHGIMLVPWLALAVASGPAAISLRAPATLLRIAGGALVLAYWVHSGVQSLMLAFGLAAAALIVLAWMRGADIRAALLRSSLILPLGLGLAAAKLSASFAYLGQFPRSSYLLPGFASMVDSVTIAILSLFANLPSIAEFAAPRLRNLQWAVERHELEYGVTAVPAVLLLLALGLWIFGRGGERSPWPTRKRVLASLLAALLLLPLLLNIYTPTWNEILKNLPLIGASSSLVRWFAIYVPIVAIGSAALIDSISSEQEIRTRLAAVAVIIFFGLNAIVDRKFYEVQTYGPSAVVTAFRTAQAQRRYEPRIEAIGAYMDQARNIQLTANRNDTLTQNVSQLACYVPIFGYRLENFPFKSLRTGPVMLEIDGKLNLKNPACFVFPAENQCAAGDHFPVSRKADAERFASYRAFPFEKSTRQKAADWISTVSVLLILVAVLTGIYQLIRQPGAR